MKLSALLVAFLMLISSLLLTENQRMAVEGMLAKSRYEHAANEKRESVFGICIAAVPSQGDMADFS